MVNAHIANGFLIESIHDPLMIKAPLVELAAAIERDFVLIPRDELPLTDSDETHVFVGGVTHSMWPISKAAAARARKDALEYLAASLAVEKLAEKAEAAKKVAEEKRDKVATKLGSSIPYAKLPPVTADIGEYAVLAAFPEILEALRSDAEEAGLSAVEEYLAGKIREWNGDD
jgi:hypothetical protein